MYAAGLCRCIDVDRGVIRRPGVTEQGGRQIEELLAAHELKGKSPIRCQIDAGLCLDI